mgnify:CR=1 FL=1
MASSDAEVGRKADTIMQQADKDGMLSLSEDDLSALSAPFLVTAGDGVVTFDEFVIVSKKFPNILFPAYNSTSKK